MKLSEIVQLLRIIAEVLGITRLAHKLDDPNARNWDSEEWSGVIQDFITALKKKTKRLMSFHDHTEQRLLTGYIIQFRKDMTLEGEPMLVINDFPPGLKGEKNPVLDMRLVYDDIELRDADYDDLVIIKS